MYTVTQERSVRAPVSTARARFRRLLTALRLFERGGYAVGPVGWTRTDVGPWRPVALGGSGRPRSITLLPVGHEDELRAFCNLIARRMPGPGELSWALSRFEMGCERLAPFEAVSDYLLGLRALLEPEGPGSGRLAGRLAAICAKPEDRAPLAERVAHAISLERAVIAGLAPAQTGVASLVDELAEHLRALLRDALCGHLDDDLRAVADGLLAEAAEDRAGGCSGGLRPARLTPTAPHSAPATEPGVFCRQAQHVSPGALTKSEGARSQQRAGHGPLVLSAGLAGRRLAAAQGAPRRTAAADLALCSATMPHPPVDRAQRPSGLPEPAPDRRRRLRGAVPPRHRGGSGHVAVRQGRDGVPVEPAVAPLRGVPGGLPRGDELSAGAAGVTAFR